MYFFLSIPDNTLGDSLLALDQKYEKYALSQCSVNRTSILSCCFFFGFGCALPLIPWIVGGLVVLDGNTNKQQFPLDFCCGTKLSLILLEKVNNLRGKKWTSGTVAFDNPRERMHHQKIITPQHNCVTCTNFVPKNVWEQHRGMNKISFLHLYQSMTTLNTRANANLLNFFIINLLGWCRFWFDSGREILESSKVLLCS